MAHEVGGLKQMEERNQAKADCLYRMIDKSDGFYRGRSNPRDRSLMNVTFNLETLEMEQRFVEQCRSYGISGLEGHRAIGGIRASIYNAMNLDAVEQLVDVMDSFQKQNHWRHRARLAA